MCFPFYSVEFCRILFSQELTERMSALLLEKAETQQSAVLLRKENEKVTQREQVNCSRPCYLSV